MSEDKNKKSEVLESKNAPKAGERKLTIRSIAPNKIQLSYWTDKLVSVTLLPGQTLELPDTESMRKELKSYTERTLIKIV
jgi:hypothetical protein